MTTEEELKELLNSDLVRTKNELLGQRQEPLELHETLPDDGVLEERTEPQERPVKAVIVDEPEIVVPVSVVKPRLKGRVIDVGKLKI